MSRLFGAVRQNGYVVRDIEAAMLRAVDRPAEKPATPNETRPQAAPGEPQEKTNG